MTLATGPLLEQLMRRLAETPADMLAEPAMGAAAGVETGAVVGDVLRGLGLLNPQASWLASLHPGTADKNQRNFLRVMLIAGWLLADPWFRGKANPAAAQNWLYGSAITELAALTAADAFVKDDERREELARLCLKALDFVAQGESEAQSQDRLEAISSVERKRVVEASRKVQEEARKRRAVEEERARKVREEMERKSAEEAAAKGTRE